MKRISEMTWKEQKLDYMMFRYSDLAKKFDNGYGDDRQLFVNTFNMIVEALESLEDEPNIYIKCAVNKAIAEDIAVLNKIEKHFKNR